MKYQKTMVQYIIALSDIITFYGNIFKSFIFLVHYLHSHEWNRISKCKMQSEGFNYTKQLNPTCIHFLTCKMEIF